MNSGRLLDTEKRLMVTMGESWGGYVGRVRGIKGQKILNYVSWSQG